MPRATVVLLDDRLLIEELLVGLHWPRRRPEVVTTSYWYYRACRAAVAGAGGQLSGPFEQVPVPHQKQAILSLLELRDDIALPDPRSMVPAMAQLARRHPRLNVMNLEVVAAASVMHAEVWLSPPAATGVLPEVLDGERLGWKVIEVSRPQS